MIRRAAGWIKRDRGRDPGIERQEACNHDAQPGWGLHIPGRWRLDVRIPGEYSSPMANASSDRGGGWVAAQAVLMVAVLVLGGTHGHQWWSPALFAVAGALSIPGAILGIWGVKALGRSRTPYPKPVEDGVLVQTGPYAIVRHPLYASVILLSFAWALFLSSAPSLIVSGILTLFFQAKAAREERWLRAAYPDYDAYARRVKRLIPWVW